MNSDAAAIALADLPSMVGKHLGHSDWHTIDQEQINRFADATGDSSLLGDQRSGEHDHPRVGQGAWAKEDPRELDQSRWS